MKFILLILLFFVLFGAHQATQTPVGNIEKPSPKATRVSQANEYTEAIKIRAKLAEVKDAMLEKRLLHELWMLTRNNKNGNYPIHVGLYISVKDKMGNAVHINQRKQGHVAYITLRGYDRNQKRKIKWNVKIKHCLLDMDNLSELMYE
ncbi:hypothetical protein BKI52_36555 [marine bacterium AO1-C]|nr:hypothetical protein BKI52_36555 [marine bacterium AO1-C]